MTRTQIEIKTESGVCPANVFKPAGTGPFPALLFFIDGIGMRPAMHEMGDKMAAHGYYVLQPDLFYRAGAYQSPDPTKLFTDPEVGKAWFGKMFGAAAVPGIMTDTVAFLAHFDAQQDVKKGKVGITGYCMGGRLAMIAAEHYPDRIGAIAAYHPGGLVTDQPDSPHLAVAKITAKVFVGGAADDANFSDAARATLDKALADAGVAHTVELFHAKHGWVPSDTPVHDKAECERHYQTLFALLDSTIR
jgi:carboxymethylenebutenolidase|nr:alpha/beta fold hydrolase [Kofleriaceae bacterium]